MQLQRLVSLDKGSGERFSGWWISKGLQQIRLIAVRGEDGFPTLQRMGYTEGHSIPALRHGKNPRSAGPATKQLSIQRFRYLPYRVLVLCLCTANRVEGRPPAFLICIYFPSFQQLVFKKRNFPINSCAVGLPSYRSDETTRESLESMASECSVK